MMRKWMAAISALLMLCLYKMPVKAQTDAHAEAAVSVSARSAILIEASSGRVLYAKQAHARRPMASTTKIMTALLTLESGALDEVFTVNADAIMVEGTSMGLTKGDRVTKRSLAYGMLLSSGNDAANAGAVAVGGSIPAFVELMNQRAEMLGLTNTHFDTPSGLDGAEHYSTAYDMARLARAAIANPDFLKICSSKSAKVEFGNPPYTRYLSNHNRLLREYDGAIGVKTGFTKKAGRCLVSAARRNDVTLIAVTLHAPNDWQDHRRMLDYGFSTVKAKQFTPNLADVRVRVVGSAADTVSVIAGSYPNVCLGTEDAQRLQRTVLANPFYYAPLKAGDVVGTAVYTLDGVQVAEIPLLAAQDATEQITEIKLTVSERLIKTVKNIWYAVLGFFKQHR